MNQIKKDTLAKELFVKRGMIRKLKNVTTIILYTVFLGTFSLQDLAAATIGTVQVIDTATNNILTTIPTGKIVCCPAITSDGKTLYVYGQTSTNETSEDTGNGNEGKDSSLSIINTTSNTLTQTIRPTQAGGGTSSTNIAIMPDGSKVYFAATLDESVCIFNTASNNITTIPIPNSDLQEVSMIPDGTKLYVLDPGNAHIYVINTASNTVSSSIPIEPFAIIFNPLGSKAYVTSYTANKIYVIDTITDTVSTNINVSNPTYMAINFDGSKLYVINNQSNTISVIDTTSNTVSDTIPVGNFPSRIVIAPDGSKVYVSNVNSNTVSVIDTTSNTVSDTIAVGNSPVQLAITPDGQKVYVSNQFSNTVSVIDTTSNTVSATILFATKPRTILIAPDGKTVYVIVETVVNDSGSSFLVGEKKKAKGYFEKFYYNNLGWSEVTEATSYEVYRDGQLIGQTSMNEYQDDHGIKKSQLYSYEIFSISDGMSTSIGTLTVQ